MQTDVPIHSIRALQEACTETAFTKVNVLLYLTCYNYELIKRASKASKQKTIFYKLGPCHLTHTN